jgi:mxaJ protein
MYSRCLSAALAALLAFGACAAAARELRVCADPHNLPYSAADGSGFENRIAELVARELGATVSYTWLPQLRGFVRKTLNAGSCDVIIGVPTGFERVRTTAPYYRSTYVFVSRARAGPPFTTFDDARLTGARIGVQLIGDDLAATPPGHALASRGIVRNVIGYPVMGLAQHAELMISALARGELDVALVWGPQAGYFARRQAVALELTPATAPADLADLPFEFAMSMGVRKSDAELQRELDRAIDATRTNIEAVLREYGVPLVDARPRRPASHE